MYKFTVHPGTDGFPKIFLIRLYRNLTQLGLKEAKDFIDAFIRDRSSVVFILRDDQLHYVIDALQTACVVFAFEKVGTDPNVIDVSNIRW